MCEVVSIIPNEIIDDMLIYGESARSYQVGVTNNGSDVYDKTVRSTTGVRIDPLLFPDFVELIESHIGDGTKVNQFDYLIYNVGDFFKPHIDTFQEPELKDYRIWTTITLLEKTDDLSGGGLQVGDSSPIFLEPGQTAIFKSNIEHQALEVTRGTRTVLVAWLGTV